MFKPRSNNMIVDVSDISNDTNIDMTDNSKRFLVWWFVTCFVVIVFSGLYVLESFKVLTIKANLHQNGSDIFLKYLFIVVAVERAVAVLVSMLRSPSKVDWALRLQRINQVLSLEEPHVADFKTAYALEQRIISALKIPGLIGEIAEQDKEGKEWSEKLLIEHYRGYLISVKHLYEFYQARFDAISKRYVDQAVLLAGIILAALGVSLFSDLFEPITSISEAQVMMLKIVDVLVTGGLLGGGSAGLSLLATKVNEHLSHPKR